MLTKEKTITVNGREFEFCYPTFTRMTEIQTEALRRMAGVIDFTRNFDRLYDIQYTTVAMERLITNAPDSWYETVELGDGQKQKILRIDKFYATDKEFMEVRRSLKGFLNSFREAEDSAQAVLAGNGTSTVENPKDVPTPSSVSKSKPDFGGGD